MRKPRNHDTTPVHLLGLRNEYAISLFELGVLLAILGAVACVDKWRRFENWLDLVVIIGAMAFAFGVGWLWLKSSQEREPD